MRREGEGERRREGERCIIALTFNDITWLSRLTRALNHPAGEDDEPFRAYETRREARAQV